MEVSKRSTGIEVIKKAPWGTHFCLFYENERDLLDILIPYFMEGLKNNEYCMWVTSEPLQQENALIELRKVFPNFEEYIAKGQIEIVPFDKWYVINGKFELKRVLNGWVDKLNIALKKGFEGLRLSGNTFWLEKENWNDFLDYEAIVDNIVPHNNILAVCTYSLKKCGPTELLDVCRTHQFALIRREGDWKMIKSLDHIRTTEKLKESEENYKTLFETSKDGIAMANMNGEIVDCNQAFLDLLGYDKEEISNLTFQKITPKKWHRMEQEIIETQILSRGFCDEYEKEYITKEGRVIPVSLRVWLKKDKNGSLNGMWAFIRDITDRKRAENRLKGFIHAISHQFRNPLSAMMSSISNLKKYRNKLNKEMEDRLIDTLSRNIGDLSSLLEKIFTLSIIDDKKLKFNFKKFQLFKLINDVLELSKAPLNEKRIRVTTNVLQDIRITGDKELFNQALQNILDNAIKFSNNDSTIEINVIDNFKHFIGSKETLGVAIQVKDFGKGIPKDILPFLFDRFYRGEEAINIPGSGLGLPIAKELINLHDGDIFVESEYKKGSTFSIFLPKK